MRTTTKAKIGLAGLGAVALTLTAALPALADYAPAPSDIVGVGGDTPQFDVAFAADGDATGTPGFNSSHPTNRLVPFLATADNNARAGYLNGTSTPLNPTVVLRAGTRPVQRVQSSGAAITALLADTGSPHVINFVSSASLPTAAQQATALANKWGYLHVVQIAKDDVVAAASSTGNAPAGLTVQQLLTIYTVNGTKWSDVGGSSSDVITPELPPSSSSITKTFLADLATAKGAPITLASDVKTVEQNDASSIAGADDIVPFSSARLKLEKSGYFGDPTITFPGGPGVKPAVKALTGYDSEVDHYIIFRQSDSVLKTPMEPGGSLNWVHALFAKATASAPTPFFASKIGQADIAAAGSTPVYKDLGNASHG